HLDANRRFNWGATAFGLGLSGSPWYSGSLADLHRAVGSTESSGNWFALMPSVSQDIYIHTNWTLSLRADGQWATEPLISNEQFGIGGVNSVRGYHEGEVYGDTGWHLSLEVKSPPQIIGLVYDRQALTVRGSVFMDYGQTYRLDPHVRNGDIALWGTG